MSQYHYVGTGAGVPGLPHVISDETAKSQGVTGILDDALAAGTYKQIGGKKDKQPTQDQEDQE